MRFKLFNKNILIGIVIGFAVGFALFGMHVITQITWTLDIGQLIFGTLTVGFNAAIILIVTHTLQTNILNKAKNGKTINSQHDET